MDKFWKCKHSDYDETFDPETGDEFQYFICKQGFDTDECDKCSNFEEEFIEPEDTWDGVYRETQIDKLKPSPHINNITYPTVCRCDMNRNDEREKEDEKCCCNCLHCARWSTSKGIECHCDLTDRYLSYLDVMDTDNDCSRWEKDTKWDLEKEHDKQIRADAIDEYSDKLFKVIEMSTINCKLDMTIEDLRNIEIIIKGLAEEMKER